MSQHIKKHFSGFTLIELVIALAIVGGVSIMIVGSLYTILISRSKQTSIETSASAARAVLTTLTNAIVVAKNVSVPNPATVEISGTPCRTIRQNGSVLEQATDSTPSCVPPTSGFVSFTPLGITITMFTVTRDVTGGVFQMVLSGTYNDAFGTHEFSYQTSVSPRATL